MQVLFTESFITLSLKSECKNLKCDFILNRTKLTQNIYSLDYANLSLKDNCIAYFCFACHEISHLLFQNMFKVIEMHEDINVIMEELKVCESKTQIDRQKCANQ